MKAKPEQPVIAFATPVKFRRWLEKHHADHPGIWLKLAKKGSGIASITYAEALDEALCLGWIDGQKKSSDENEWLQKFTRRGPRSVWSKINVGHVSRLAEEGRMQAAGLATVEAAKTDGRWDHAYHSSSAAEMPEDFMAELARNPAAEKFFDTLSKANLYAIFFRLQTARKPETRAKRLDQLIAMLNRGESIHPVVPKSPRGSS